MRLLAFFLLGLAAAWGRAAEVQFVGVMADATRTWFAVRAAGAVRAEWLSVGESVDGFRVVAYDAKAETLTLEKDGRRTVVKLADGRVQMSRDEVVAVLERALGRTGAKRPCDLLHPKLQPLFKAEDCDSAVFRPILAAGTKLEIREIPEEFAKALADGLAAIEKIVGVRPTHGLWITGESGFSMAFVVRGEGGWHLAPSAPGAGR